MSGDLAAAYSRAAELLPWRITRSLVEHRAFDTVWGADGDSFAYRVVGPSGERWMVGAARTQRAEVVAAPPPFAVRPTDVTPDPAGRRGIGQHAFNLWLVESGSGERRALTSDGVEGRAYAPLNEFGILTEAERKALSGPMRAAQGLWSPDGRYFATYRYDQTAARSQRYSFAVPEAGYGARPRMIEQRAPYPGEANAFAEIVILDTHGGRSQVLSDLRVETFLDPISSGHLQWSSNSETLYLLHEGRGLRTVTLHAVDPTTGKAKALFHEESDTYLMLSGSRYPALWRVLADGRSMIWYSERDGWGNLYRVDLNNGRVVHPLTRGPGVARSLLRVDEAQGWAYFVAVGREAGIDPYFRQLYRVRLNGSAVERLTPEPVDHNVSVSPAGKFFIDTQAAALDSPPSVTLRSLANGTVLKQLASMDLSPLRARGWQAPQRFRLRDADDRYDVYATVFKPSDYRADRRYPVVDYIYAIPCCVRTPAAFPAGAEHELGSYFWHAQATAELGFIVVMLDAPGTPQRGYAFARESYGAKHVDSGLRHHVAVLRQLAARDSSIDVGRAGLFGASGGGFTAARAMLFYPEFFKVGVAVSGAHDLMRLYLPEYGERYVGPFEEHRDWYEQLSNTTYAERLQGKLLLIHGEADSEVSIVMTQQFVHALIAANKDFDLLYLPNRDHALGDDPYAVRRRWDYLVTHLLGATPPAGVRLPSR